MYDFTTIVNRTGMGAIKWDEMKKKFPGVPENIIPFSVADMEFKSPPEILEGLKASLTDAVLGYTGPTPAYYRAVCGWMQKRHHWKVEPRWIITSPGVVPAFFNAVNAYSGPGDGIIIMPPVYPPFFAALGQNARRLAACTLLPDQGRYRIDFDDLERKARDPGNKVLILCSPHNPVGRVWEPEELKKIAEICLRNKVVVVSDEIHFDLIMPGFTHTVFSSLGDDAANNCVVCTAPSKTFNIAGLHVSNIIIQNDGLRQKYQDALNRTNAHNILNIMAYRACEIAYTQCEPWLDELLTVVDRNRALAEQFIRERIPAIRVYPMEGTYLQWWDCRDLGMDYRALEQFMTEKALLFLDEGYVFGECGQGFERIDLACPTAALQVGLERLAAALDK